MASHAPRSAMSLGADLDTLMSSHRTHVAPPLWRTKRPQGGLRVIWWPTQRMRYRRQAAGRPSQRRGSPHDLLTIHDLWRKPRMVSARSIWLLRDHAESPFVGEKRRGWPSPLSRPLGGSLSPLGPHLASLSFFAVRAEMLLHGLGVEHLRAHHRRRTSRWLWPEARRGTQAKPGRGARVNSSVSSGLGAPQEAKDF